MKYYTTIIITIISFVFVGCQSNSRDKYAAEYEVNAMSHLDNAVEIHDKDIMKAIDIQITYGDIELQPTVTRNRADFEIPYTGGNKEDRVIQVGVYNKTEDSVLIAYRVEWFNEMGILLNVPRTRVASLKSEDYTFLKSIPNRDDAVLYRVVINNPQKGGSW